MAALKPTDIPSAAYWFSCSEPGGYTTHGDGSINTVNNLIAGGASGHDIEPQPEGAIRTDIEVNGIGLFQNINSRGLYQLNFVDADDSEQHIITIIKRLPASVYDASFFGVWEDDAVNPKDKMFVGLSNGSATGRTVIADGTAAGSKEVSRNINLAEELWLQCISMRNGMLRVRMYTLSDGSLFDEGEVIDAGITPPFRWRRHAYNFTEDIAWPGLLLAEVAAFSALTEAEIDGLVEYFVATYSGSSAPYPGTHTVANLDNVSDPNCIYFDQGVDIGDTFSFKETTEINGWGVDIDVDGYPIIDSGGAEGTDSFLFDIDKGAGYENPSEWTFTIGGGGVGSNVIGGAFQAIGAGSNVIGGSFRTLGAPSAPTYPDRRVTIDRPYTADLSAGWKFSDGSDFTIDALPTGLTMSTAGIVTGTPTVLSEVTVSTVSHMGITSNAFTWTVVTRPPSGTLADAKFDALRDQGFTGTISDMTLQWLQANGATSGSITDAWLEVLPGTGQRNDRWYTVLGGMGYTGSLNDREFAFWVDGGLLPGTVDVGPANLEAFLISEGWGVTRTGESFVVRSGVHEWWFTWSEAEAGVYEQDLPAPLRNDIDDSFGR